MRGTLASSAVTFARMKCGPSRSSAVCTAWVIPSAVGHGGHGAVIRRFGQPIKANLGLK